MSDNTLYYTFSTIAQTLAAAFGVLTAIVVIRLPALEAAVQLARSVLLGRFSNNADHVWQLLRQDGIDGMIREGFDPGLNDPQVGPHLISGHSAWVAWGKLIPAVWLALVPTGLTIAVCLVALPFVPPLIQYPTLAAWVLGVTVFLATSCLLSYGLVIARLLGQRADHPIRPGAPVLQRIQP